MPRKLKFTLIEFMVTASIVGILSGLAIPNLRSMIFRARATEVAADMDVVRVAALQHSATMNTWPAEVASGVVPAGLVGCLPEMFLRQEWVSTRRREPDSPSGGAG